MIGSSEHCNEPWGFRNVFGKLLNSCITSGFPKIAELQGIIFGVIRMYQISQKRMLLNEK
jgi:hypothetical protein